jgi:DMSO/TMAO reductase YedYZ molybdopterin-dependent catalytic subunit
MLAACSPLPAALRPGPTAPPPAGSDPDRPIVVGQIPTGDVPSFVPLPTPTQRPTPKAAAATRIEPTQEVPAIRQINEVVADPDTLCHLPVIVPAKPAVIPAVGEIDASTGRHMMGIPQELDVASYRLQITGLVDHPLELTYADLLCLPKVTETVTTRCYNFSDTATWSGVLISDVLKKAGLQPGAQKVVQKAADDAARTVTLEMALDPHNFLAYQMGKKPLPILFGFPVRSIFIDVAGQYSVKWLTSLEVI